MDEEIAIVGIENNLRNLLEEEDRYASGIENAEALNVFLERESELQREFMRICTDVSRNHIAVPKFNFENDDDCRAFRAANDALACEKKLHEIKLQIHQQENMIAKASLELARIRGEIPKVQAQLADAKGE